MRVMIDVTAARNQDAHDDCDGQTVVIQGSPGPIVNLTTREDRFTPTEAHDLGRDLMKAADLASELSTDLEDIEAP